MAPNGRDSRRERLNLMPTPILVTKLFIPTPRDAVVPRRRLLELLDQGVDRDVTILCAPAGFGKTTLLSAWVAASDRQVAWVSLDPTDSDPTRFLTYVIAGLEAIAPGLADHWLQALQSPQPPPTESVLVALLNEISSSPTQLILVLDDYHAVDSAAVDTALAFLLEHLPPQLHLIISSRQDPGLPLARLRARGQLTEVRAADLRFTPAETAEYLTSVMGLRLTGNDIATLERRTEGWIAGLQLAALSIREHHDAAEFIRGFAGDHRYIADYLVGEVLGRQPDDVRDFLIRTAVLDQMSGPLCDAVTGQQHSHARLEALYRGNFFLVPLDDQRHWYRYHHLFGELLRAYLTEEQSGQVPALHRRASQWFEHHGSLADAVRHSLAAGDVEHVADLVERAAPELSQARQEATLLTWLRALPDDVLRHRPVLNASYAGVLLACGVLVDVEARLDEAERWLAPDAPVSDRVVVDQVRFRRLPGAIAMWRAGAALMRGDEVGTVTHARQALDIAADDDHLTRGGAAALLGLTFWGNGHLDEAFVSYTECIEQLRKQGHLADMVACAITLADIRIDQGRLGDAMAIYATGLQLATTSGGSVLRGAADMHVGMSELSFERGDLAAARQQLTRCEERGESLGLPQNPYRRRVAEAHLQQADGDLAGAVQLLVEAERVYDSDFSPKLRPVPARKARVWVAQDRVDDALGWAQEHGLSAQDELCYVREFEHITLARVLLAQHRHDAGPPSSPRSVMDLLERLLYAADDGGRTGSVIEILVLQALGHHLYGATGAALVPLERALALAEPEGYVRTFLDAGAGITDLLHVAAQQGMAPDYVRRLLAAGGRSHESASSKQVLIDPLSKRELDVLRLLGSDLSGPQIARELVVSLHTVRSHTKSIYAKLGVNNRRTAVRLAEELDLMQTTGRSRLP